MDQIVINGGKALYGRAEVSGFKNAALPVLFATVLTEDVCTVGNVPDISDVELTLNILRSMGISVEKVAPCTYRIDARHACWGKTPAELVNHMRGSMYVIGAELGRFGHASAGWPGGCDFGSRPIDQHIKAFEALGAVYSEDETHLEAHGEHLVGTVINFDVVSVGATVNAILAATRATGMTVLENAAHEPHIVDLANFLNACGADIKGAGTDVIKIRGVPMLHGCTHDIIPDMIEAGTYMIAAAVTGGRIEVANVIPKHLESITAKLREIGVTVEEGDESVTVYVEQQPLLGVHVVTRAYPGFPTDMHPQMSVLLCLCDGISTMTENIWHDRFRYVPYLHAMGASIIVEDAVATIQGGNRLLPAKVEATDLRAGAAMILAGLAARGKTEVGHMEYVERGYDNIVGKLRALGADIEEI